MKHICLFILTFCTLSLNAQIDIYKFSAQIDSVIQKDTIPWRFQLAAWDYSYIGEYHKALKTFETPYQSKRTPRTKERIEKIISEPKAVLSSYKATPAIAYITKEAQKTRLVIINEAHHSPRHRVFVQSLLPTLYNLGYTQLGIETLNYSDSLINSRKYPTYSLGNYSKEPSFGNMIRSALDLGIQVFPYETKRDVNGMEREIDQASQIKQVMDQHPQAKFIIYCGFDHAIEDSTNNSWVLAMAGRLKALTGIDPLTIDQIALTETGDLSFDNPYRMAIQLNYDAVFIDSNGKAFNKADENKYFDVNVYHPTTKLINGRPNWLMAKNKKYKKIADKIIINFPCLVFAYNSNEDSLSAVPIDIIELNSNNDSKRLIINKKGLTNVVVINRDGQKQQLVVN